VRERERVPESPEARTDKFLGDLNLQLLLRILLRRNKRDEVGDNDPAVTAREDKDEAEEEEEANGAASIVKARKFSSFSLSLSLSCECSRLFSTDSRESNNIDSAHTKRRRCWFSSGSGLTLVEYG
jgi:hypothetical protein